MQASLGLKPSLGSILNLSHPLARGLAALWLLNEGAGTLANDLIGPVPATPDDRMWFGGAGLRCDGSNFAAFGNDGRVFAGNEVSVFASIVPTGFGAGRDDATVFSKGELPYTLYLTVGGGKVNLFTQGDASWLDGSASVPLNARSVVGATKGPDGRKTWLNGLVDASDGVTAALSWSSLGGRIGHRQDNFHPSDQFQGLIEWVAFWNRALAPAEVGLLGGSLALQGLFVPMRVTRTVAVSAPGSPVFRRTDFNRAGSRGS